MSDITKSVKFLLLGEDRTAGSSLRGVGNDASRTHGKLDGLKKGAKIAGAAIGAGLLVAGAAAVKFGQDSLVAFADAEKSQRQLEDAYKRFPAVQSVPIEKLREYNQELQRKTGADADDVAAGQSVLARYKMTGDQLKQMTPLLVDYSARTGKDIPASASTLGKALMGSSKAVKELGLNVKLGKDPAENYKKVMNALKTSVGGYAEAVPEAEKKQKILQASFGDLQEAVGEKLQPAMIALIDAGQGVLDWLEENPEVAEGASAAFDLFGDVLEGLWDIVKTYVAPALAWMVKLQANVVRGAADMLDALGNVPGFEWAKGAATKVRTVADSLDTVAGGIDALSRQPKPKVDVTDEASPKVQAIDDKIRKLEGKKVKAEAEGDTKKVEALQAKIDALKDKKIQAEADVKGGTDVDALKEKIGRLEGKKVKAEASGDASEVATLQAKIDELKGKAVDAEAKAKGGTDVSGLKQKIDNVKGKNVTVTATVKAKMDKGSDVLKLNMHRGGKTGVMRLEAAGGVLKRYAAGGRESHVAQIARAGDWRVWAEDETGGEAYIPLANDWRRPRAVAIWRQTGRELGMYAGGGIRGGASTPGGGSVAIELHVHAAPAQQPDAVWRACRDGLLGLKLRQFGGRELGIG